MSAQAKALTLRSPHLVRHFDREPQLRPLLLFGEDVAFLDRGKAALRRQRKLLDRREFLREAARSQIAIVYYAGHGVQIDGRNWLIPVDAQLKAGWETGGQPDFGRPVLSPSAQPGKIAPIHPAA
jgi:hypothetical protein